MTATYEELQEKQEVVFTITISPAPTKAVGVRYITRDGTAIADNGDYTHLDGIVTFEPGDTTKLVRVPVTVPNDGELEFYLDISWISKPSSDTLTATGTIHT